MTLSVYIVYSTSLTVQHPIPVTSMVKSVELAAWLSFFCNVLISLLSPMTLRTGQKTHTLDQPSVRLDVWWARSLLRWTNPEKSQCPGCSGAETSCPVTGCDRLRRRFTHGSTCCKVRFAGCHVKWWRTRALTASDRRSRRSARSELRLQLADLPPQCQGIVICKRCWGVSGSESQNPPELQPTASRDFTKLLVLRGHCLDLFGHLDRLFLHAWKGSVVNPAWKCQNVCQCRLVGIWTFKE